MTEPQFNSVVSYISKKLQEQPLSAGTISVSNLQEVITYQEWKEEKKPRAKKPTGKYIDEWNKFWSLWPATKSVPGTQYISGAKMKSDEQKMYDKWLAIVDGEGHDVAISNMYKAAECYLAWGYSDSIRKGRNELETRSGLEPWMNQKQYLTYYNIPMPQVVQTNKSSLYTEA